MKDTTKIEFEFADKNGSLSDAIDRIVAEEKNSNTGISIDNTNKTK